MCTPSRAQSERFGRSVIWLKFRLKKVAWRELRLSTSTLSEGIEGNRRPTQDEIDEHIEYFESNPRQVIPICDRYDDASGRDMSARVDRRRHQESARHASWCARCVGSHPDQRCTTSERSDCEIIAAAVQAARRVIGE